MAPAHVERSTGQQLDPGSPGPSIPRSLLQSLPHPGSYHFKGPGTPPSQIPRKLLLQNSFLPELPPDTSKTLSFSPKVDHSSKMTSRSSRYLSPGVKTRSKETSVTSFLFLITHPLPLPFIEHQLCANHEAKLVAA